ncbi:hypothetical protein AB0K19_12960 [Streptomyces klenkii]
MSQGLPVAVHTEPGRHRLDRLALPVQQQPPQMHPAPPALVRPRERLEHIRRELLQITPDHSRLLRRHTRSTEQPIIRTRHQRLKMTKPY